MDYVFHLAGLADIVPSIEKPESYFKSNVLGTFNVLEACVKQGVKRLVYSSSASVYGDAIREPMDEEHPFDSQNLILCFATTFSEKMPGRFPVARPTSLAS